MPVAEAPLAEAPRKQLTVKQVAARLQVTPGTIYLWAAEGKIPVHRIGTRLLRFYEDDFPVERKALPA